MLTQLAASLSFSLDFLPKGFQDFIGSVGGTINISSWDFFFGALLILIGIAISIVPMWIIFEKAGQRGWKALIPFYNVYTLFKICWKTTYFWIYLILMIASIIPIFGFFCVIAAVVFYIIGLVKLALSFNQEGGFAVGLVLFTLVFEYIMAFDKRIKYVGADGKKAKK